MIQPIMTVSTRVIPVSASHTDAFAADERFTAWMHALESRHLADLRFAEVTRALRALSSAYVQRRHTGGPRAALDSAGKRAAFALFYAPLHFIATWTVVRTLGAERPAPSHILDIGCGTGVAGAAWALAATPAAQVIGIDRHPWAVEQARWTYAQLGVRGRAQTGDIPARPRIGPGDALVAAYVLNELADQPRLALEDSLVRLAQEGVRVLVLEPISRQAVPWWSDTAARLASSGFRADDWRFGIDRPPLVKKLDEAAGLDHRELRLRSLYHP